MRMQKLKFNPHVVWADTDGFHVFGYGRGNYCYLAPDGECRQWLRNQAANANNVPGIHHFNHVRKNQGTGNYELMRIGVYGILSRKETSVGLTFFGASHPFMSQWFWTGLGGRPIQNRDGFRIGMIPLTANFDLTNYDDKEIAAFAWGNTFLFENHRLESRVYKFYNGDPRLLAQQRLDVLPLSCTDAKFSPDGTQLAIAVKDGIKFVSVNTIRDMPEQLPVERELAITGLNVHHMAYSLDGCTLAAVTKCHKLVVWDVD